MKRRGGPGEKRYPEDESALERFPDWCTWRARRYLTPGLFAEHLRGRYGVRFEKPAHTVLTKKNCCIHAWRWLVERTLAWLGANRRLSKEYDRLLTRANAWITLANIWRILKFC